MQASNTGGRIQMISGDHCTTTVLSCSMVGVDVLLAKNEERKRARESRRTIPKFLSKSITNLFRHFPMLHHFHHRAAQSNPPHPSDLINSPSDLHSGILSCPYPRCDETAGSDWWVPTLYSPILKSQAKSKDQHTKCRWKSGQSQYTGQCCHTYCWNSCNGS